ncbi:hypothetical protein [Hymenobacter algoricola]|uniref:Uncharacterized protein n=1 Tax=Hymenobacter algoricola TaxID=486267 RepID=A0ABP7NB92_9BACT
MEELHPFTVHLTLTVQVQGRSQHGANQLARAQLQELLERIDRLQPDPPAPAPGPAPKPLPASPPPARAATPAPVAVYPRPFATWSHRQLAAD